MSSDIYSTALIQAMARNLSVSDLIRTIETLRQSGQSNSAETLYATWIGNNQDNPLLYAILFNYSVVLSDAGKLAESRTCLERAISLNADFMPAYINLGRVLERQGTVGPALVQWSAVLAKLAAVNGQSLSYKTTALNQSARALEGVNQDAAAEEMLRQSLELDYRQREVAQHYVALRQRQCEWPVIAPLERVPAEQLRTELSPLSAASYTDDPMYQLAVAWGYNKSDVGMPSFQFESWPKADAHSGRLKIGYLTSDMREHALGHLVAEVPALHDRNKVEVFSYFCGPASKDPLHENFKKTSDHWVPIGDMDDVSAAKRIADDGIQILIDLNGYTRDARVKLFALRPAPVIVNWLGYPGTMASPYHNYIVADDWIIPEGSELYYSEKVLRLPCYQPSNRNRSIAPLTVGRKDVGLPEDGTVYCCFNGAHKITRYTFDRWLLILSRVPGSVLWLLGSTETANKRLRDHAAQRGIAPERIVFADKLAHAHHLARYVLADLFLDTTPYGAHTTASDALWMGVPVLTLSGRSFASRVCGSLVRSAGLPEMVCTKAEDYVERAVTLGLDRRQLAAMRDKLLQERDTCTLFDMPGLVQSLEALYLQMWCDYRAGELPRPNLDNLDVYLEVGSQVDPDSLEVQTLPDYEGWWKQRLAKYAKARPIRTDARFWR